VAKPHQLKTDREVSSREGEDAAKRLAQSHYENFSVGSFLLPREIRQELYNIYAFCRLADDFADETAGGVSALDMLDNWERQLNNIAGGIRAQRPDYLTRTVDSFTAHASIFTALDETIHRRKLAIQPFRDLLTAFRRDLVQTRYETWEELLDYCHYSANPVGRLVLGVSGVKDTANFALSDNICTALQLANHWQDIAEDYQRGRVYIPVEILGRFGVTESALAERKFDGQFRDMMVELVGRTEELFTAGKPLLDQVPSFLKPQLYLYWGGGMAALAAIKANGYDVLNNRSRVRRIDRIKLAAGALGRWVVVRGRLK